MIRPRRPGHAVVVAYLALFVALGGSGYAAVKINGKNIKSRSISGKRLKKSTVTGTEVKNRSLGEADFKLGQLPAGPQGLQGPQGVQGPPGPFGDPVPRGTTLRGIYGSAPTFIASGDLATEGVSFGGFTLSSAPTPHYIPQGANPPAECVATTSNASPSPGHLCVYERFRSANVAGASVCGMVHCPGSEAWGFDLSIEAGGAGIADEDGAWAVTAP